MAHDELIISDMAETESALIIQHAQDVSHVLNDNIASRNNTDEIWGAKTDIKIAARLDWPTVLELERLGIMQDKAAFFGWLELHPEYKAVNKTFAKRREHFTR